MLHFSEEYLEKLVNEHKFIKASLNRLNKKHQYYMQTNSGMVGSVELFSATSRQLLVEKLILEVKIDELTEFLKS